MPALGTEAGRREEPMAEQYLQPSVFFIGEESQGQRLDRYLGRLFPDLSLRARRRLIESGRVLLNLRPARSGVHLKSRDRVEVLREETREGGSFRHQEDPPRLVQASGHVLFFYKPRFLHTLSLSGGGGPSLEAYLPEMCDEKPLPHLVQRLDFETSGIVTALGGADWKAELLRFRQAESEGRVQKKYLALLTGRLDTERVAELRLDTENRVQSKVVDSPAPEVRWTHFEPLFFLPAGSLQPDWLFFLPAGSVVRSDLTVTGCTLYLGARHQIRAHAASLGFPLLGDSLYGSPYTERQGFFLHQASVRLPSASCVLEPTWLSLTNCPSVLSWLTAQ